MNYIVIFFVSFCCILLELFWTKILNLKAWNHVVYTVIPFAILGYGIGANIQMVWIRKLSPKKSLKVLSALLLALSAVMVIGTVLIVRLPIRVDDLLNIFVSFKSTGMLLLAYTLFVFPFVLIGLIVVHLFSNRPKEIQVLYFVDLVGAGFGAAMFFFLLNHLAIVRSILVLAVVALGLGISLLLQRSRWVVAAVIIFIGSLVIWQVSEPVDYTIDKKKGWEYIPGYFKSTDYDLISARWHPLGRTDIYRISSPEAQDMLYRLNKYTFLLNVSPRPEFSYFTTNFLAGTPVYRYPNLNSRTLPSEVKLFSQSLEIPYVLFKNPKVFIIGTGGGRDIFMAKTHGASKIVGAEINPETFRAMSKGGEVYEYSGKVYDQASVYSTDGRHLVKVSPKNHYDLIILNGVDTFSGLSSGAYAYAESYLYTKEAFIDYLKILNDDGMINLNRWLFIPPRETLRLLAIALEALQSQGVKRPWDHILVLGDEWSTTLVKKTPFTDNEIKTIILYAHAHQMRLLYPSEKYVKIVGHPFYAFDTYVETFKEKRQHTFEKLYQYDISVTTDDKPFFFKYYKFSLTDFLHPSATHHTGPVIFWTQFLVLLQAIVFIILFIIFPLVIAQRKKAGLLPSGVTVPFIIYFACLGMGYMFIEIPIMQKFVLLLGTPICSISVVLSSLLVWTGVGSLIVSRLPRFGNLEDRGTILFATLGVIFCLGALIISGKSWLDIAVGWSFAARILLIVAFLAPLGIVLGTFFPLGLKTASFYGESAVAWAWAINCGFSVLGSILAIILAQFLGFNYVLFIAAAVYLPTVLLFKRFLRS